MCSNEVGGFEQKGIEITLPVASTFKSHGFSNHCSCVNLAHLFDTVLSRDLIGQLNLL